MKSDLGYKIETTVKLYDTDAAGIMFFGNYLRVAHDAYQAYLESCGFSFAEALNEGKLLIPIVHAEADYIQALAV
jgi:1,4-dihydroxy-2-naphthoyl-CoA hydrolase